MPVIIPRNLPAFALLQKDIFVMDVDRAHTQDIRPLEILILNLMPLKINTENQFLSLLANSPLQINITLLSTASYVGVNTAPAHLAEFYKTFAEVRDRSFDAAIITGAPVEHLEFSDVAYWSELTEIFNYLKERVTSTMYICWGALASLWHFYKIPKVNLSEKLFGIFPHKVSQDNLTMGMGDIFYMPHSRHSTPSPAHVDKVIKEGKLKPLITRNKRDISVLKGDLDIFITGHPEYDRYTLYEEFNRDKNKGLEIRQPKNYLSLSKAPSPNFKWRSDSSVLFSNWINFVYQNTPYQL